MTNLLSRKFTVEIVYTIKESVKSRSLTDPYHDDEIEIDWTIQNNQHASSLYLTLTPKTELILDRLDLVFDVLFKDYKRVFVNGYQSWTESHERALTERLPHISALAKRLNDRYQFSKYGDYEFVSFKKKKGYFHGWTYAYLRNEEKIQLMASLNESTGFTVFELRAPQNKILIHKDVAGVKINQALAMDLFFMTGADEEVFDAYFDAMEISKPTQPMRMGWTSWYNYYQNINQDIIDQNLSAARTCDPKMDIIQIDDGYQSAVGDWLIIDETKFPLGMKAIAEAIKAQGSLPGIWMAPFVVQKSAQLVKDHPEWILKDTQGNFEMAGYGWGGNYVLDLENKACRDYIRHCFDVVFNDWGFELVKLDFLYAAALGHHPTKTRGQRCAEAMDFLRSCVNDKMILGCGVPLGSAFGKVEYCRIGPDISLDWVGSWYHSLIHREQISTRNAVLNSIGRRHLDHRAFLNDPDVFLLRNTNIKMTDSQKEVLAQVNHLFGSLLFTSDLVSDYDDHQKRLWASTTALTKKTIHSVTYPQKDAIEVRYRENGQDYLALINLSKRTIRFKQGKSVPPYSVLCFTL